MRLVLDTSVLIAAYISRAGVCSELYEEILLHHELVISGYIVAELRRKLRVKFAYPEPDVEAVCAFLLTSAQMVEPETLPSAACRDPADLPILGTATAGRATLLVTVDRDLLVLGEFRGIAIVRPGEVWPRLDTPTQFP
ncbi:MAG: putative toxin-antitoxin system toxin component, PIN family [Proteobacteria bacterium]|nr:putative toxin-antitoxin system toxin component, PIN family [Pseudomonadota bacterium]